MKKKKSESEPGASSDSQVPIPGKKLGDRIEAVADLLGTRINAAFVAGVSVDMLAKYIAGTSRPRFDAMVRLAAAAGVSLDWLATGEGEMLVEARETPVNTGLNSYQAGEQETEAWGAGPSKEDLMKLTDDIVDTAVRVLSAAARQGINAPDDAMAEAVKLAWAGPGTPEYDKLILRLLRLMARAT